MPKGFKSARRKIRRMKRGLETRPDAEAHDILTDVEDAAKRKVYEHDAVASTELFRSFLVTEEPHGDGTVHRLANVAPHAIFVEFGTGDKWQPNPYTRHFKAPPMSPHLVGEIKGWLIMKPTLTPYGGIDAAAVAIALGISGNLPGKPSGTPAQPFMRPAWFKVGEFRAKRRMRRAVKTAIRRA